MLGDATIADIRVRLPDAPGESAVRGMVGVLVKRGVLKAQRDGKRNVFRLAEGRDRSRRRGLAYLRHTLFDGSTVAVVAALLDESEVSSDELDRLAALVERARAANLHDERTTRGHGDV